MKTIQLVQLFTILGSLVLSPGRTAAAPLGTAFSYQGRLADRGVAASGVYDLQFALYDQPTNGTLVAGPLDLPAVSVSDGLLAVTLDFGGSGLDGQARWLEIGLRTNASSGDFTVLTPRQALTPTPFALALWPGEGSGIFSPYSVICGGRSNLVGPGGTDITICGGSGNRNEGNNAFLGGGTGNLIQPGYADNSSCVLGGGMGNVIGSSSYSVLAGGRWNFIWSGSEDVTLSGGRSNVVQEHAYGATIGGGEANTINGGANHATIGGGSRNRALGYAATVGGGRENQSTGTATVAGGENNGSLGYQTAVGGGYGNMATGDNATVAGGRSNLSQGEGAAVGGGANNGSLGDYGTVGGGLNNSNQAFAATVGGGTANVSLASYSTVSGGGYNYATGFAATVAGGGGMLDEPDGNSAFGDWSTVGGGRANGAWNDYAAVGGGENNLADGQYAAVPGGLGNQARGQCSFAAGENAIAEHDGAFVWADASFSGVLRSTSTNQFTVRASGGIRLFTDTQAASGVELAPGSGSWSTLSDRQAKQDLRPVEGRAVLEQLARLPLSTWTYKTQAPGVRHLGPMAQDFSAAFGVGEDDRHIASVDADGVALAAIQGLNQKLDEALKAKDDEIAELRKTVAELKGLCGKGTHGPR